MLYGSLKFIRLELNMKFMKIEIDPKIKIKARYEKYEDLFKRTIFIMKIKKTESLNFQSFVYLFSFYRLIIQQRKEVKQRFLLS